jgi:hypothetical protein
MGRPKKLKDKTTRTNLVLTEKGVKMLDTIARVIGATSRSEALRMLILEKYREVMSPQTGVGIATSLRGITDGNELTEEDFEELKGIWGIER